MNDQLSAGVAPGLQQGGLYVELQGQASGSPPVLSPSSFITVLGKGRMPEPLRHSRDFLMTGNDDDQWVEVKGVVSAFDEHRLTLVTEGGPLIVWINNEIDERLKNRLLGSVVRVSGVCSPVLNSRNQRLGVRLLVPTIDYVEIMNAAPADPFSLPTVAISNVMASDLDRTGLTTQLVKTKGVVTYKQTRMVFVQDGTVGLRVDLRSDASVKVGERVEAVGLAMPDGFSPKLVQALVRKVGIGSLPPPAPIDLWGNELNSRDATRAQMEAILLGSNSKESIQILELRNEVTKQTFSAFFSTNDGVLPVIPVGSKVQVCGVFKAETDVAPDFGQVITTFDMYLGSPQDIKILERPPWWTTRHAAWLFGGLGIVLFASLIWLSLLRKEVRQRTSQLRLENA